MHPSGFSLLLPFLLHLRPSSGPCKTALTITFTGIPTLCLSLLEFGAQDDFSTEELESDGLPGDQVNHVVAITSHLSFRKLLEVHTSLARANSTNH